MWARRQAQPRAEALPWRISPRPRWCAALVMCRPVTTRRRSRPSGTAAPTPTASRAGPMVEPQMTQRARMPQPAAIIRGRQRSPRGGDLASTGMRDRGARAEDSIWPSLNPGGNQRNCGSRLRSRCLITSERSPRERLRLGDDRHQAGWPGRAALTRAGEMNRRWRPGHLAPFLTGCDIRTETRT